MKNELLLTLDKLISNWENEVVEFKEANKDFDKEKIGKYFSAISNEANLKNIQYGWLVFGVRDKDKAIVGSDYRLKANSLEKLKDEIAFQTTGSISFIDIFELYPKVNGKSKRVIMMQIPAAVAGIPTGWKDHYYGRNGESLGALSIDEIERIRSQQNRDWSKKTIETATIEHLDKNAIVLARNNYKEKMKKPHITEEVDNMTDEEFLTKIKLIQNGKITNACMLLLGNEDYDYLFSTTPEASWRLYNTQGDIKDYEIFKVPFITLGDRILKKIRNLTYRYMTNANTLFPSETDQYDNWLLRELLNNCIAHSDYLLGTRIYIDEEEDQITFKNPGSFLPGSIQTAIQKNYNSPFYRNQLLAETMVKLNMIDTQSMGIRKVFKIQKEKYFPMPDYDFSTFNQVKVTVYGKILNDNYTQVLFNNPNFDIETVYLIDRVQKYLPIDKEAAKYLRKLKVIEGRFPNIYISNKIAEMIDKKADYVKNKAFDDRYYQELIINYLKNFNEASRDEIRALLFDKLSDVLTYDQKDSKVKNLLQLLKRHGIIETDKGAVKTSKWRLTSNYKNKL
ncbi:MAG: ATP-binding protein [Absicoccus sp.]|uniref:ATP-binding protein n=1 Tax=Absicoccus sp. TaxID=2718527 RepID=UPI002A7555F5|nr:ATP-binding protein [Absicoccus sp.]MDY3035820.1 ATP-binding protein [Absicoccus sp.]